MARKVKFDASFNFGANAKPKKGGKKVRKAKSKKEKKGKGGHGGS